MRLRVGHQHSRFLSIWPVSWTITHRFGVPKQFPWLLNPKVRLRVGHQHSKFWPILGSFMDYYSLFWGPGLISTITEPRGTFMCRSSTLAVFVDSDRIRRLLITLLGPKAISIVVEPQGVLTCWSSRLVVWVDSGPFLDYYSLFSGPKAISTINEPRGAFTCRSSALVL